MFAVIPGRGPVALPRETGADGGSGKSRTAGRSSQRRSRGKATKKVRMKRSDAQARAAARAEAGDRRGAAEDGEDEEGGEGEGDDDDGIVATYRLSVDDLPPFANILVCLDEELPPGTGAFVFLGTPPLETDDWLAVNVLTAERQSGMPKIVRVYSRGGPPLTTLPSSPQSWSASRARTASSCTSKSPTWARAVSARHASRRRSACSS